jgi:hypothetical protein
MTTLPRPTRRIVGPLVSMAIVVLVSFLAWWCYPHQAQPLAWDESAVLPDKQVLVLKRVQTFDERGYEKAQSLEFTHPVTKQLVRWQSDDFFSLRAVFMDQGFPHIVVAPTFSSHNEWAGCPFPSAFIYKFIGQSWQQVPYALSPVKQLIGNVTADPKSDRERIKASGFRLAPGLIRAPEGAVNAHTPGLYFDKFPVQVFECLAQKRFNFQ